MTVAAPLGVPRHPGRTRPPLERQRLAPAERFRAIRRTALQLFAERHYSLVTVREVAQRCRIAPGLIYRYFDSKDHLFRSALDYALEQLLDDYERRRPALDDPLSAIAAWLDAHAALAPTMTWMAKIMGDYAASGIRDAATDAAIATLYDRERALLEQAIGRGIASGVFRSVDVPRTARLIGLQIDGIFFATASRRDDRVVTDLADVKLFVRDYLAAGPSPPA